MTESTWQWPINENVTVNSSTFVGISCILVKYMLKKRLLQNKIYILVGFDQSIGCRMAKFSYNGNILGWSPLGHAAQWLGCRPTHLFSDVVSICCRYICSDMSILANPINHTTTHRCFTKGGKPKMEQFSKSDELHPNGSSTDVVEWFLQQVMSPKFILE